MKKLHSSAPLREPTPHSVGAVDPLTSPRLSVEFRMIAAEPPTEETIVRIFHKWIQEDVFEGVTLIDVANYAHVQGGPGILLIGHESFFSVAIENGEVRFRYGRKGRAPFGAVENLETVFGRAEKGARRFAAEVGLTFTTSNLIVGIDDRLYAPNTYDTFASVKPVVEAFIRQVLQPNELEVEHSPSLRLPFRMAVRTAG